MRFRPVNAWGIPTEETEAREATTELLSDKLIDDGFDEVRPGSVFAVSGGGRRIEVTFDEGFTAAQVFAPGNDDVVCFEPMAAPTDALRRGGYRKVNAGESAVAQFRIKVI
jgi:galactose mutarotase-like enzyme